MPVRALTGEDLAQRLSEGVPASVERWEDEVVWVDPSKVEHVARFLRDDSSLDFQFLNAISAIDFIEYFDVVYHLTSFRLKHSAVIKTRVHGRESLSVPSVYHCGRGPIFKNGRSGT
jgi:NADH-quinone oxidoreductase subunit C